MIAACLFCMTNLPCATKSRPSVPFIHMKVVRKTQQQGREIVEKASCSSSVSDHIQANEEVGYRERLRSII